RLHLMRNRICWIGQGQPAFTVFVHVPVVQVRVFRHHHRLHNQTLRTKSCCHHRRLPISHLVPYRHHHHRHHRQHVNRVRCVFRLAIAHLRLYPWVRHAHPRSPRSLYNHQRSSVLRKVSPQRVLLSHRQLQHPDRNGREETLPVRL